MTEITHILYTPGPTKVPEAVLKAIARQPMHHRSQEFREVMIRVNKNLQYIFQTTGPVLTLTCSGTGAMEASFVNLFSRGDRIIVISNGKFSDRWIRMPREFGFEIVEIKLGWGKSPTPSLVRDAVINHSGIKAVYLTHCETSTGATTDIQLLARIIRENSDALVCVDGVSSVGALEFKFDEWGVDAAVTASQKALMCQPGLSFIALSEKAIKRITAAERPKFYFNLNEALLVHRDGLTPWTPAASLIAGIDVGLEMIRKEEITNVWNRHRTLGALIRDGIVKAGFKIFPDSPSDSVTVAAVGPALAIPDFLDRLKREKGIILAGGQGEYKDKLIRIGHMGYYFKEDMEFLLNAINMILSN